MLTLSSCSLINDESDCVDSANVFTFTYDRNLKFADAFASEVKSVSMLAFDLDGTLAYASRTPRTQLIDGNGLAVNLTPGEYDILVWAGNYDSHFNIPTPRVGQSKLSDFECLLKTDASHPDSPDADAKFGHSSASLESLFHCLQRVSLPYASPSAPARHTLNLTKDTNSVRIMLQQQNADSEFNPNDFIIEIEGSNAHLLHDNSLNAESAHAPVIYHPWDLSAGSIDYNENIRATDADGNAKYNYLIAELTTGRLCPDSPMTLRVSQRESGKELFTFPLINYALEMRGAKWSHLDPADFLDRQDDYSLTFVLDRSLNWTSVSIIINGWRKVFKNQTLS